jgi:hypothetical protein
MTETPQLPPPADTESKNGRSIQKIVTFVAIAIAVLVLGVIVVGVLLALFTDVEQTVLKIQLIRDVFIIALVLQGILVITALAILILQIARLINLLQNEVMPILKNTQETVSTARGTVEFVSSNLAEPVMKLNGFLAAISVLLRELFGIRRAIRPTRVISDEGTSDE